MPDLIFHAYDGLHVTLEERRYRDHILSRHNDVSVDDIRVAVTQPHCIWDHRDYADRRVYEGRCDTGRGLHRPSCS